MALLPDSSFSGVNDIETAQGAPVSEAIAQKYGSNENNLDARATTNASGIATNVTAAATNATAIAAAVESFATSLNPTGSFQTIFTFAIAPSVAIIHTSLQSFNTAVVRPGVISTATDGTNDLEYRLTGTLLEVRESAGSASAVAFVGVGFV